MKTETAWSIRSACALILLICVLALTSCAHGTARTSEPIPPELLALLQLLPSPDADLLKPCPTPPLAADDQVPTLLRNQQIAGDMATRCRNNHLGLIDAYREAVRYEAERIERARKSLKVKPDA